MLKLCRQYLCWIQNSVFEGELSEAKLRELKLKIKGIIDQSEDSIILFTNKIGHNMDKQILGKERMSTDNFLQQKVVDVVVPTDKPLFPKLHLDL